MKAVSTRVMSYGLLLGHMNAWMALADDVVGRMRHKSFENHERKLIQGIKRLANCVADGEVRHSKMPEASQVFNLPGACDTLLAKCNGIIEQVSSLQIDRAKDALKPGVAKLSAMKGGIPDGRDWKKEAKQAACLLGHANSQGGHRPGARVGTVQVLAARLLGHVNSWLLVLHPHTQTLACTHTHNTHTTHTHTQNADTTHTHNSTHTHTHMRTATHTHTKTETQTHSYAQAHTRTHKNTHTHKDTHRHTHTHTNTDTHIQSQKHTESTQKESHTQRLSHTHTNTHTHPRAHTHTHTRARTHTPRSIAHRVNHSFSILSLKD